MSRGQGALAVAAFVLVLLLLVALLYQPTPEVPETVPDPVPAAAPAPRSVPAPMPHAKTPRPTPEPEPEPEPSPTVSMEPIPVDVRRDANYAMDEAVQDARRTCLQPWADMEGPDAPTTMVMDAVLTDGQLTDVAVRGIGDVPGDVVDCARDAVWRVVWPEFEHAGELRFQRSFTVEPQN